MKLKSLKLQNFFSHEDSFINFDKVEPVTMVLGSIEGDSRNSNGSGKTSIIEAILFSLFEKSRLIESKNGTLDDMVRWNSNGKMVVEFQFELNNQTYKIFRSRDKNKQKSITSFEVFVNNAWKSLSEAKKNDTNKQIIKLIGIDYETFCASICLQQKEVGRFISASESERKTIIKNILQLDRYDNYKNLAKAKLQTIENEINQIKFVLENNSLSSIEIEAKEKNLIETQKKIEVVFVEKNSLEAQVEKMRYKQISFNEQLQTRLQIENQIKDKRESKIRLLAQKAASEVKLVEYSSILKNKTTELKQLEKSLDKVDNQFIAENLDKQQIVNQGKAADKDLKFHEKQLEELSSTYFKFQSEIERVSEDIKKVNEMSISAHCPTCFNCISDQSKNSALEFLQTHLKLIHNQFDKAEIAYNQGKQDIKSSRDHLEQLKEKLQQYGKLTKEKLHIQDTITRLKNSIDEAQMMISDQNSIINENTNLIDQFSKEIETLEVKQEESKATKKQQQEFDELLEKIQEKVKLLNICNQQLSEYQMQKGKLNYELEQMKIQLEKQNQAKSQRDYLNKEKFHYEQLVKLFGKDIPTFIVENACLELSEEANKILRQISNDSIDFVMQRTAKDGSQKEVFEIEISRPGVDHPILIDNLSNGQKFRVVFAIRIALSRLLTRRRNSAPIDFLFYDECFASLDDKGVDDIIGIFKYLKKDFNHQLIITHGSEVKERFSTSTIVVQQDYAGVSNVKV